MRVSPPRPVARRAAVLAASTLATALAVLAPTASAHLPTGDTAAGHAAKTVVYKVKVDPRLFGVHDANLTSLSQAGTGSIRLWDTGTTWADVQPSSGVTNFSRLDQIVNEAHANGTEVTLVTAMTPSWAAADQSNPTQTSMPDLTAYANYVTTLMTHYKDYFGAGTRGIANYQVWNEANVSTFWTGTAAQMAQLTKTTYDVRNRVDPGAKVIAPAVVTRLAYQQKWIKQFYAQTVDGQPVWKYVDAISLNLYPLDTYPSGASTRPGTPEDSVTLLSQVRSMLSADNVATTVPIWDTEINYGMRSGVNGGTSAAPIPDSLQVAYVMRTFLLNAAQGIKRVDWYAYDMGNLPDAVGGTPLGNTLLTDPDNRAAGTLTPAGQAYHRIQGWMAGTMIGTTTKRPCTKDSNGTYTCVVKYATNVGRIYWNPSQTARVTLVKSAHVKYNEYGVSGAVQGGQKLKVGAAPVLVRSKS